MPLLRRRRTVRFQNLMNDRKERPKCRPCPRHLRAEPRRLRVREDLLQGVPMDAVLPARLTHTDLVGQHPTTNLGPSFHVRVHSGLLPSHGGITNDSPRSGRGSIGAPHFSIGTPDTSTRCTSRSAFTFGWPVGLATTLRSGSRHRRV